MSTQHIPAPWTVSGKQVKFIDHGKWYTVATANNPKFTDEANASNARLIAAAPDLLDALRSIAGHDREFDGLEDYETMVMRMTEKARAAIARATGEDFNP